MKKVTLSLMIACFSAALTLPSCKKSEGTTVSKAVLSPLEEQLKGKWFSTDKSQPYAVPYLLLDGSAGAWPDPYKTGESFGWGADATKAAIGWYAYYDPKQDKNVLQTTKGTYTFSFIKDASGSTIMGLTLVSNGVTVYTFNK